MKKLLLHPLLQKSTLPPVNSTFIHIKDINLIKKSQKKKKIIKIHPQSVQMNDVYTTDNNSLTGSWPKQVPWHRSLCSVQEQDSAL